MSDNRVVLRGGRVVDGSGAPPRVADVLLADSRVGAVGAVGPVDGRELDVGGLVVTPGFVDAHAHAETVLARDGVVPGALAQGVTAFVLGQDGCGWAPGHGPAFSYMREYFAAVNGDCDELPAAGLSVAELLARLRSGVQHVAYLVPHGLLRAEFVGLGDEPADVGALRQMLAALEQALADGAVGLSTGFDYVPSRFARHEELVALSAALGSDGVYVSHMQGYGARVKHGLSALTRVGAEAGVAVHASHLWGPPPAIEQSLVAAARAGVELTFDMYPYRAGSSLLAMVMLPPELQSAPVDTVMERLADPATRAALVAAGPRVPPKLVTLSFVDAPEYRALEGRSLAAAAELAGRHPLELTCELLRSARLRVGVVRHGRALDRATLAWLAGRAEFMAGSDGIYLGSHPHPRGHGAFTRLLLGYLREDADDGWARAVRHLSTAAADRFGLHGRGRLVPGSVADVAVFDPARIQERAKYEDPCALATGTRYVFTAGELVWEDG